MCISTAFLTIPGNRRKCSVHLCPLLPSEKTRIAVFHLCYEHDDQEHPVTFAITAIPDFISTTLFSNLTLVTRSNSKGR
jgi:hypothetical protein